MPDRLPPCDPEIHRNGKLVFLTNGIHEVDFEGWVKDVAKVSSLPVDWHVSSGRQLVLTLSPVDQVVAVMLEPEREEVFEVLCEQRDMSEVRGKRPFLRSFIERAAITRSDSLWGDNEYAKTLKLLRK